MKSLQVIRKKEENDDEEIMFKVYKIIKRDLMIREVDFNDVFFYYMLIEKQFKCSKGKILHSKYLG